MSFRNRHFPLAIAAAAMFVMSAVVISVQPSMGQIKSPPFDARVQELLDDPNATNLDAAIEQMSDYLAQRDSRAAKVVAKSWLPRLQQLGQHTQSLQLAVNAIEAFPADTRLVGELQKLRVRALLKLERYTEALAGARGLFNVSTMQETEASLLLVAECLRAAHPQQPDVLELFIKEQQAGCSVVAPHAKSQVMLKIALADEKLSERIRELRKDLGDFAERDSKARGAFVTKMVAAGNLLLISGEPDEALREFELALDVNRDAKRRAELVEGVARCIKAQDGSIGRANAYAAKMSTAGRDDPRSNAQAVP